MATLDREKLYIIHRGRSAAGGLQLYRCTNIRFAYYYAATLRSLQRRVSLCRVLNDIIFGLDEPLIEELPDARRLMAKYGCIDHMARFNFWVNRSIWNAAFNLRFIRLGYTKKMGKSTIIMGILDGTMPSLSHELGELQRSGHYKTIANKQTEHSGNDKETQDQSDTTIDQTKDLKTVQQNTSSTFSTVSEQDLKVSETTHNDEDE